MTFKKTAFALILGAVGVFATGCGSPCDDLADECEACLGANAGTSCDIIREGDSDACDALLGSYENNPACTN